MSQPIQEHGQFVRRFRRSYGITLEQLAGRTKLSQPTLTMFEKGARNLSADAWARVLTELGKIEKENNAERKGLQFRLWLKTFIYGQIKS